MAAFAVYDMDGVPAALLVVIDAGRTVLDGMERIERLGLALWLDHCKGHTVVRIRSTTSFALWCQLFPKNRSFV